MLTGHTSLVTTAVEIPHHTAQQVPLRLNGHIYLVIATKEVSKLEGTAVWIGELVVNTHLYETIFSQQVSTIDIILFAVFHFDVVHHLTRIIQMNNDIFCHRSHVSATEDIDDRAS